MKACSISVSSCVDGVENAVTREGEISLSLSSTELFYREEDGEVRIFLQGDSARIERTGEYSLHLFLKEGETSEGILGIFGREGSIPVRCNRVAYSVGKGSLLLSLWYGLNLGEKWQEMKLRIHAREKKESL